MEMWEGAGLGSVAGGTTERKINPIGFLFCGIGMKLFFP